MVPDDADSSRSRMLGPLGRVGGRAAELALRPWTDAMSAAVEMGTRLEQRAVDRVLDSQELERILTSALDSPRLQAGLRRALASDGARQLIDGFFDSGLFDLFIERLAASDALWRLIDEIAASPAVRAALSKQGLGFADQVGDVMRERSRKADGKVERIAGRLTHRRTKEVLSDGDTSAE